MRKATGGGPCGPWLGLVVLLAALAHAGCDSGDGAASDGGSDGGDAAGDGPFAAATCSWAPSLPELTLPRAEVKGVLRGQSRNASTTCTRQKGAGGPEALYVLRVTTPVVVDLEVTSTIDTVLAVRRTCDDPLSELACNDDAVSFGGGVPGSGGSGGSGGTGTTPGMPGAPLPAPPVVGPNGQVVDAGVAMPPTSGRDARLRLALDPGVYFVLVDEAEPHGVGGDYALKVTSSPPTAQASCAVGQPVSDGTRLFAEQLDVASAAPPACGATTPRAALYYTAKIPSGQRLTARVTATRGDRAWSPVLQLLSGCTASACLTSDSGSADAERLLRYVNNGPAEQAVILAISANGPVSGAHFQLDVNIGEVIQNGTCETARLVRDGQVLLNQDLSEGSVSQQGSGCKPSGGPSLFYKATLLPRQTLIATVSPRGNNTMGRPPVFMTTRDSCGDLNCTGGFSDRAEVTNTTGASKNVIIEVSGLPGVFPPAANNLFDIQFAFPLPPGAITVTPTRGLSTNETGTTASFTVVLDSPSAAAVTIPVTSGDAKEGTVSPPSLRFEPASWNQPQTVTITGVNDALKDGPRLYQIGLGKATSADPRYDGLDPPDVEVTNDDDEPGFRFAPAQTVVSSEAAVPVTISVTLNRAPTATVRLPVSSSDEGEARVSPAELVFEPATWATPQVLTVTGVDDTEQDGVQSYKIVIGPAASADAQYAGVDPEDLSARNLDNDFVAVAPKAVNGNLSCPFGAQDQRIGADEAGSLYVLMSCTATSGSGGTGGATRDGGAKPMDPGGPVLPPAPTMPSAPSAFATVSLDGGKTFAAPVDTGLRAFDIFVHGLVPGTAVAVGNGPQGLVATRTDTAGASWDPPQQLLPQAGFLRVAAAGKRVVVAARPAGTTLFLISEDGGKTYSPSKTTMSARENLLGIGIDQGGAVWMMSYAVGLVLRKSSDGGQSFSDEISLGGNVFVDTVAFGPKSAFAAGKEPQLLVAPLLAGGQSRQVMGLGELQMFPRVLVPDRGDGVTVLDNGGNFGEDLVARRLAPGGTSFGTSQPLGTASAPPAGVALSEKAVAVTLLRGDQVFVGVTTF